MKEKTECFKMLCELKRRIEFLQETMHTQQQDEERELKPILQNLRRGPTASKFAASASEAQIKDAYRIMNSHCLELFRTYAAFEGSIRLPVSSFKMSHPDAFKHLCNFNFNSCQQFDAALKKAKEDFLSIGDSEKSEDIEEPCCCHITDVEYALLQNIKARTHGVRMSCIAAIEIVFAKISSYSKSLVQQLLSMKTAPAAATAAQPVVVVDEPGAVSKEARL